MNNEDTKTCIKCGESKSTTEYYANAKAADRLLSSCKPCHNKQTGNDKKKTRSSDRWFHSVQSGYRRADDYKRPRVKFTTEELLAYWESLGISSEHSIYTGEPLGDISGSDHVLEHVYPLEEDGSPGHILSNVVPADRSDNRIKGRKGLVEALADIHKARGTGEAPKEITDVVITRWGTEETA